MKKFINEAKARGPIESWESPSSYGYDQVSPYMELWGTLLQAIVSQAGTYLLTKKFHGNQCGIYKCEGGCHIDGVGDLVLLDRSCHFDYNYSDKNEKQSKAMSDLVTHIIMNWDPNDPIKSMVKVAADYIKVPEEQLMLVLKKSNAGGVFGGNSLSNFFDRNPFAHYVLDPEYRRFCLVNFQNHTNEQVDLLFADEALGRELYKLILKKAQDNKANRYLSPMCCSPRRMKVVEGSEETQLMFWINTGRSTQLDGWHTEEEIREYLKGDGKLNDKAKW